MNIISAMILGTPRDMLLDGNKDKPRSEVFRYTPLTLQIQSRLLFCMREDISKSHDYGEDNSGETQRQRQEQASPREMWGFTPANLGNRKHWDRMLAKSNKDDEAPRSGRFMTRDLGAKHISLWPCQPGRRENRRLQSEMRGMDGRSEGDLRGRWEVGLGRKEEENLR